MYLSSSADISPHPIYLSIYLSIAVCMYVCMYVSIYLSIYLSILTHSESFIHLLTHTCIISVQCFQRSLLKTMEVQIFLWKILHRPNIFCLKNEPCLVSLQIMIRIIMIIKGLKRTLTLLRVGFRILRVRDS